MIRDYALAASGLLVRKLGGPSVKPYQPEGVWEAVAMIGSQHPRLQAGQRREPVPAEHVHVLEAGGPAGLDGDPERPEPRDLHRPPRPHQHAASQALLTLNDVQFVEAARVLAEKAMKAATDDDDRIDFIAEAAAGPPVPPAGTRRS